MQYAVLAILIITVIAFFVVLWKAAPYWRWYNLVCASLTMILAVVFLYPTAGVLSARSAWHQVREEQEDRLEKALAERQTLNYGDPNNPAAGKGVVILTQELSKLSSEAGRRWRGLRAVNADPTSIKLVPPNDGVDPNAGAAVVDAGTLVPEGLIVYGFAEQARPDMPAPVPNFYLGEFRVSTSDAGSVTLQPTTPLEDFQVNEIANGGAANWSLYELLPLDGHEPFVAEGSLPDDENLFGRVDAELIDDLFGNRIDVGSKSTYLRDGSRATTDDVKATRWVKVEFNQPYTEVVDNPSSTGVLDGGFFDGSGRAVDPRLQRGGEGVAFEKGDQLVVKEEAAKTWLDENVVVVVDSYFVRPLNDYRYVLREIRLRLEELATRKQALEFERKQLEQAKAASDALLVERQSEAIQLEEDLTQTEAEKAAAEQYKQTLETRVKQTRETLTRLYRVNQQLENEIQQFYNAGAVSQ